MQNNGAQPVLERTSTWWTVVALIGVLFAITNLPWTLNDYDQAKQAFTSFEMVSEGHWLYQHTPNEKIATKPPLVGWMSAACYGLVRTWELAWRIPSLAAAIALGALLARHARAAYGATAGLLAFSAFGLNLLSVRLAALVRTDMPLALSICLIGLVIWRKVRLAEEWRPRDRALIFWLLTAAMLTKGPIVYAFLLPGIAVFEWRRRSAGGVRAWCGWWPWVASLFVFLIWAAGGIFRVNGFYEQVVVREFAARFGETVHRSQPLFFYVPHLLHKFAPWSVLGGALAVIGWRLGEGNLRTRWRAVSPEIAWLICWAFGGLLLMSLVPSKRVDRIFPIVPPLCLLIAAGVARLSDSPASRTRILRWTSLSLAAALVFTSGYAAQRVIRGYRRNDAALVDFGAQVRQLAAAKRWRYGVVGGRDEGLLLYLRRTHFLNADQAVAQWNAGDFDALVVPAAQSSTLLSALPGAAASMTSRPSRQTQPYVLLTKTLPQ